MAEPTSRPTSSSGSHSKPSTPSGLSIRRRASKNNITTMSNNSSNNETKTKFLELLNESEHARAVAFMGATKPTTRIHLNTTMKKMSPELRASLLDFLDVADVPTCELLLSSLHFLSPESCGQLFLLQHNIDFDRYLNIVELEQEQLQTFLNIVGEMSDADAKSIFVCSDKCGMSIDLLLELMLNQRDEDTCPMCKARRRIKKEFLRIHDLHDKTAKEKFNRPTSLYENELVEKRDFTQDPLSDFFSLDLNEESGRPEIKLSDAAGRAISSKYHFIDTKLICDDCKNEVYEYALRVGNDDEIWHTLWQGRLEMHEKARDRNRLKSKWWGGEIRDIEYKDTVRAIVKANKNTKKRKREAKKMEEKMKKLREEEEARNLLVKVKKKMISDAVECDGKWMSQELRTQQKSLGVRNLAASLEFEMNYGLHENSILTRKNDRSSKLNEYHPLSGIPLTKAAASAAFGTDPIIVEDESHKLRNWNLDFKEAKEKLDWRRDEQRRQREAAERSNFNQNLTKWKADSQEVLDKINQKYKRQQFLRTKKIEKRDKQKMINQELRNEMRLLAERRAQEDARMELERQEWKAAEEAREGDERWEMSLCECDQRAIDRFWGLPTDAEKQRRLEDFLRKQFEARIRYQRAMMVAVGGEIATSKAFEKRVPDILRIEKYRITKLL